MALITLGGQHWNPLQVGFGRGKPGRPKKGDGEAYEMLGYSPKKDGRGKLTDTERKKRRVNVWSCHAVYALFHNRECVYIGEGKLGDRINAHWNTDSLVGRWDTFTWLSPSMYKLADDGNATIENRADTYQEEVSAKALIELLELVAIHLGAPESNSQLPSRNEEIVWLTQERSQFCSISVAEKLDKVLELLEKGSK